MGEIPGGGRFNIVLSRILICGLLQINFAILETQLLSWYFDVLYKIEIYLFINKYKKY